MNNIYRLILSMCIAFSFSACNNTAPVADAGPDQNIITGSLVTLDGRRSSDPDNDTLSYNWSFTSKPAGSSATLSDETVVNPAFTADVEGTYSISLVVNDSFSNSQPDTVTITAITPDAGTTPVADAGIDQNVITGSLITLDGSKSSDPNNDALSYNWSFISKPAGSSAAFSDETIVNPAFTADVDGTYSISLVVNDGFSDSQSDTVKITAAPFSLISTAFLDGETIPKKYACAMQGGNNISPPFPGMRFPKRRSAWCW